MTKIKKIINFLKQVCIYGFSRERVKRFHSMKRKSIVEKIEDIEILRFFELNTKVKMTKLNSNSIAVDEINDIPKVEKLLRRKSISK